MEAVTCVRGLTSSLPNILFTIKNAQQASMNKNAYSSILIIGVRKTTHLNFIISDNHFVNVGKIIFEQHVGSLLSSTTTVKLLCA